MARMALDEMPAAAGADVFSVYVARIRPKDGVGIVPVRRQVGGLCDAFDFQPGHVHHADFVDVYLAAASANHAELLIPGTLELLDETARREFTAAWQTYTAKRIPEVERYSQACRSYLAGDRFALMTAYAQHRDIPPAIPPHLPRTFSTDAGFEINAIYELAPKPKDMALVVTPAALASTNVYHLTRARQLDGGTSVPRGMIPVRELPSSYTVDEFLVHKNDIARLRTSTRAMTTDMPILIPGYRVDLE